MPAAIAHKSPCSYSKGLLALFLALVAVFGVLANMVAKQTEAAALRAAKDEATLIQVNRDSRKNEVRINVVEADVKHMMVIQQQNHEMFTEIRQDIKDMRAAK